MLIVIWEPPETLRHESLNIMGGFFVETAVEDDLNSETLLLSDIAICRCFEESLT